MTDVRGPLTVFVPSDHSPLVTEIAAGSGIVGSSDPEDADRVIIDYEGNLYTASNVVTFADRVHVAAGRHTSRYPTVARQRVSAADVVAVGEWDGNEGIVRVTHPETLATWLGAPATADELMATDARYEQVRAWRQLLASPDPALRRLAEQQLRQLGL